MGRPRKTLPPNGLQVIRDLAANGVQEAILAKALGMGLNQWRRIREEDPEAKAAWEEARALEQDKLAGELYRQAIEDKNTTAAIFLLKARHGYRDQGPVDGGADSRVAIVLNLPAPLSGDQYGRLLEAHPKALASPQAREAA